MEAAVQNTLNSSSMRKPHAPQAVIMYPTAAVVMP